jgi:hypothetical protein
VYFFLLKVAWAGERTWDLLSLFIFLFNHLTAEPQRLPIHFYLSNLTLGKKISGTYDFWIYNYNANGEKTLYAISCVVDFYNAGVVTSEM